MNCHEIEHLLNTETSLDLPEPLRSECERHLAVCPDCRESWDAQASAAALPLAATPAALRERIAQLGGDLSVTASRRRRFGRGAIASGLIFATVAAALWVTVNDSNPNDAALPGEVVSDDLPEEVPGASDASDSISTESLSGPAVTVGSSDSNDAVSPLPVLDRYSVVVMVVPGSNVEGETPDAVRTFHDKLIDKLERQGFIVFAGDALTSFISAATEDVAIARAFGASTLVVLNEIDDRFGGPLSLSWEFVDVATESAFGVGTVGHDAVAGIEDIVLPGIGADQLSHIANILSDRVSGEPQAASLAAAGVAEHDLSVLNLSLTDEERVVALQLLGSAGGRIEDAAVVSAAIDIAEKSEDGAIRGRVWQALRGANGSLMIPPLLRALESDSSAFARQAAAEALGEYADNAAVRQALSSAAIDDPSARVRGAIVATLRSDDEQANAVKGRVLDTDLPTPDRLRALIDFSGGQQLMGLAVPIDDEIAAALLEMAVDVSERSSDRAFAVSLLGETDSADSIAAIGSFLSSDADPAVRAAAASALSGFADLPAVRDLLANARDADSDRRVRSAARAALDSRQGL